MAYSTWRASYTVNYQHKPSPLGYHDDQTDLVSRCGMRLSSRAKSDGRMVSVRFLEPQVEQTLLGQLILSGPVADPVGVSF